MIQIQANDAPYGIKFPESVEEINVDDLTQVLSTIRLPKHYCVIALAFRTTLFDFCASLGANTQQELDVTPLLAKISDDDSEKVGARLGDKVIVTRTEIERAVHLPVESVVTSMNASLYIQTNKTLYSDIMGVRNPDSKKDIILIEFKIIPVTSISAARDRFNHAVDPYVYFGE